MRVEGEVQTAEISGSESIIRAESIIRFNVNHNSWVSEAHGAHSCEVGKKADFMLSAKHCMHFGSDNRLMAF